VRRMVTLNYSGGMPDHVATLFIPKGVGGGGWGVHLQRELRAQDGDAPLDAQQPP
jgi:hypothetical protein